MRINELRYLLLAAMFIVLIFLWALGVFSCAANITPEDKIAQNANNIEVGFRFATRESLSLTKHYYPKNEELVKDTWLQL